ncbi:hypothetical protein PSCICO_38630 [Pseudomonas cichorii]|uniref:DUF2934 domain-containing protein n=1 Tax=Pseudomonas serbiensis TaxID=3064350 RepID=A0ABT9CL71_9PSED|nr:MULTISPECIES: DUF2934 domain-containing protein [Pseudomonas]MDO7925608.1 DUF2934 domain-containing protein [Pseudomonas sp. KFB-138]GFM81269.1 hypothetical protein PSCICN_19610 [Pseudomonas cichorii]GFM88464.1 hypothetical protein PSCICO_38630 [Pseudomonas cichorii]
MSADEKRIREFAYQIWESEGKPTGQEQRHWEMARKLAEAEALAPDKTSASKANKPKLPKVDGGTPKTAPSKPAAKAAPVAKPAAAPKPAAKPKSPPTQAEQPPKPAAKKPRKPPAT